MFTVVVLELPSCGQDADRKCGSPGGLALAVDGTGTGSGWDWYRYWCWLQHISMEMWVSCPVVPITMTMQP